MKSRGLFIVFEGGEGSGKSTQAEGLRLRLLEHGHQAVLVHEPGTTNLGQYLRNYLKSKQPLTKEAELLLFEAARAQLVADEIRPALERGYVVIADRFAASSLAYQGYGRRIELDLVHRLNDFATSGLSPDLTILLDIEPAQGLARVSAQLPLDLGGRSDAVGREDVEGHRRFEDQPLNFHALVRAGYRATAEENRDTWLILDARRSQSEIAEEIWDAVGPRLPKPAETETLPLDLELRLG
jgi:dTMP kinase